MFGSWFLFSMTDRRFHEKNKLFVQLRFHHNFWKTFDIRKRKYICLRFTEILGQEICCTEIWSMVRFKKGQLKFELLILAWWIEQFFKSHMQSLTILWNLQNLGHKHRPIPYKERWHKNFQPTAVPIPSCDPNGSLIKMVAGWRPIWLKVPTNVKKIDIFRNICSYMRWRNGFCRFLVCLIFKLF